MTEDEPSVATTKSNRVTWNSHLALPPWAVEGTQERRTRELRDIFEENRKIMAQNKEEKDEDPTEAFHPWPYPTSIPCTVTLEATLPHRGSEGGMFDLFAAEDKTLKPEGVIAIDTGVTMEIPKGFFGDIRARSGHAVNLPVIIPASTIDGDYRGTIKVLWRNLSTKMTINVVRGMAVAQICFLRPGNVKFFKTNSLTFSRRGILGFGSTGHNQ